MVGRGGGRFACRTARSAGGLRLPVAVATFARDTMRLHAIFTASCQAQSPAWSVAYREEPLPICAAFGRRPTERALRAGCRWRHSTRPEWSKQSAASWTSPRAAEADAFNLTKSGCSIHRPGSTPRTTRISRAAGSSRSRLSPNPCLAENSFKSGVRSAERLCSGSRREDTREVPVSHSARKSPG